MRKNYILTTIMAILCTWAFGQEVAPYIQSFDATTIPTNWSQNWTTSTSGAWLFDGLPNNVQCTRPGDNTGNAGSHAWMDQSGNDVSVNLVSPAIDVSGLTVPRVTFFYYMCGLGYTPANITVVEAWNGTGWVQVDSIQQFTNGWEEFGYNVSSFTYAAGDSVQIRFRAESGGSTDDFYGDNSIDDFRVFETPSCQYPGQLAATNLMPMSADLGWVEGNAATEWLVEYGPAGFTPGTGTVMSTFVNPLPISGLTPDTQYEYYVAALCPGMDTSIAIGPRLFQTTCAAFTAPYVQYFDNETAPAVQQCWTVWDPANIINDRIVTYGLAFPAAWSLDNSIEMYNGSGTASDTLALVSPQFTDMGPDKQVRFYAYDDNWTSDLVVGTVSDPSNASTFTAWETIPFDDMPNDAWEEFTVTFAGYTGTDQYIAFKHGGNNTFDYIHLDDIRYEVSPSCPLPLDLATSNVTNNSAIVSWIEAGTATQWEIEYGPAGFATGTGAGTVQAAGSIPGILSGLMPETDYDFYVRSICAVGDTSPWSNPGSLFTLCDPFTAPYYQNWDAVTIPDLDPCWRSLKDQTGTTVPQVRTQSTFPAPYSGTNYAEMYNGNGPINTGDVLLISPLFSDLSNDKRIRFFAFDDNWTSDLIVGVMTDPADAFTYQPIDTLFEVDMVDENWEEYIIEFTGYASGPAHIVFKHGNNNTFDYLHVDDFRYEVIPTCAIPSALVAQNVINDGADLAWTENGLATEWEYEYGPAGFVQGTGTTGITTSLPAPITGLTATTAYDFYIRAICTVGDSSPWSNGGSFFTQCDPFTAPYSQSWDGTTAPDIDECWTPLRLFTNTTGELLRTYIGNFPVPNTGVNCIEMGNSSGTPATGALVFVSPRFSDFGPDKRIRFFYYDEDNFSDMYVGTMSDANDFTTFTPYDTLLFTDYPAAWTEVTINFDDYTGTDQYIAFYHGANTTFDEMYLDDFNYELIPSCQNPLSPGASNFSSTTADLFWTAGDTIQMEWEIEWGPTGFVPGTGTLDTTSSNPYTLTGLTASTTYDYYVRGLCDPTTVSPWTNVTTFTTLCNPFTATYTQNFDGTTAPDLDQCWSVINTLGTAAWARTETTFPAALSGTQTVEIYNAGNVAGTGDLILVTPEFSDMGTDKRIRFWAYDDNLGSDLIIGTLSDVADPTTFTPYDTITEAQMGNDVWEEWIISFDNLTTTDKFIGFKHGQNTTFDRINVEDFVYEPIPFCPDPQQVVADFVGFDAASISWTPSGANIADFLWEVQPVDSAQGSASVVASGTTPIASVNTGAVLMEQTTYDFYVQVNCTSDSSAWIGPLTFTTICAPFAGPYCMEFGGTAIPQCWEMTGVENWQFRDTPTGHIGNVGSFTNANGVTSSSASGGGFAWVDDSSPNNLMSDLFTPLVSIAGLNDPSIDFWYLSDWEDAMSSVEFSVSLWDGAAWNDIFFNDSTSVNLEWEFVSIPIDTFTITGPVQVRFRIDDTNTTFDDDVAIDDVCINGFYFYDATVSDITTPESGCGEEFTPIEIVVSNLGIQDLTNVPVLVDWSNATTGNFTTVIPFLAAGASDTIVVDSVNTLAGGMLDIVAYTGHALDEVPANDSLSATYEFDAIPAASQLADNTICLGDSVEYANPNTGITARWYDGSTVLFTGDTINLDPAATTTYGVEFLGSTSENVGETLAPISGFITLTAGWGLRFHANESFILNSVTLYPSGTGEVDIAIIDDLTGAVISSTGLIPITDGGTPFSAVTHPVNITIPANVQDYRITLLNYTGLVSLGRNSSGTVYPFISPSGACEILGSSTGGSGATGTTHYWFFDWDITIDGCPSERTFFTVNVNEPTLDTTVITACDTYTLEGGDVVTMSGVYTDTLVGANGCDRFATQDVTINMSTSTTNNVEICDGTTYDLPDGTTVSDAGTYTTTVTGANGCDEITITVLALVQSFDIVQNVQICDGDSLTVGSSSYGATGTYVDLLTSNGGCDSTVTTNLVVNPLINVSISGISTVCSQAAPITLGLSPLGGVLSGPGVTGSDFDPIAAGVGTHTVTYTFTSANGCSASASIDVDVVVCTGIDEISGIETVSVYPNPFNESINILFDDAVSSELTVTLYDVSGRVITKSEIVTDKGSNKITLDATNADAAGVYFIQLEREGATFQTRMMKTAK